MCNPTIERWAEEISNRLTTIWIDGVACECHAEKRDIAIALQEAYKKGLQDGKSKGREMGGGEGKGSISTK